jgi:tetratricopeptide (TPR) repeat protein
VQISDLFKAFRERIGKPRLSSHPPSLATLRNRGRDAAIIFVHGFQGRSDTTWSAFSKLLMADDQLAGWDIYSAGYETNLSIDLPIWTSDPDVRLCAQGLITKLALPPLDRYQAIAVVAHSMGGLIVQRAILNSETLRRRLTHSVLFGTPSDGVSKAVLGAKLKHQARDMQTGSPCILEMRSEWGERIGEHPPFLFRVVAGESDAFIPSSSSLAPFPEAQQEAVPGNHLTMVRPGSPDDLSYKLLRKLLSTTASNHSPVESARLAVEHNQYRRAIDLLLPGYRGLDENAIVLLSLALESTGDHKQAIQILEQWQSADTSRSLDPLGTLGGRLKRRWLVDRQVQDFDKALALYTEGYERAKTSNRHDQAYYHAINVAYLHLARSLPTEPMPKISLEMAKLSLEHVSLAPTGHWSYATKGEAYLILGRLDDAMSEYEKAKNEATTLRECESMYLQAIAVAQRAAGDQAVSRIAVLFGHQ